MSRGSWPFFVVLFFVFVGLSVSVLDGALGTTKQARGVIVAKQFEPEHWVAPGKVPVEDAWYVTVKIEGEAVEDRVSEEFFAKAASNMEVEVIYTRARFTKQLWIRRMRLVDEVS